MTGFNHNQLILFNLFPLYFIFNRTWNQASSSSSFRNFSINTDMSKI